ncbi:MAG: transcription elongation factor GreA [Chloroflexota bacterium]|nr:transcription elongation factor GreA [Chloroflexota bacterium]
MTTEKNYLTPEGFEKLSKELDDLKTSRRREVAEELKRASEVGGTVDNAEYDEAKRDQATVEGRIFDLEQALDNAEVIPGHDTPAETVEVGSIVVLKNSAGKQVEYTIVGSMEADPAHGRISNESPVGHALLGKRVGEEVDVHAPGGEQVFTLVDIR